MKFEAYKCYLVEYKTDPTRKNAKIRKARIQVLEVTSNEIITNRRPWNEGGTGSLSFGQIINATEIPRP